MKSTTKKHSILLTCITAITFTMSFSAHAKIYKWTDDNGQVHYSAQPPKQTKKRIKSEDIEARIKNYAGKYKPGTEKNDDSKKTEDKTEQVALSGPSEELQEYCKNQKNTLAQLKKNFRNIWIDAKGKKTILDQKQRQEKVNHISDQIKRDCSEVKSQNKT